MKINAPRQYTIRNVPRSVDLALRKKAQQQKKSMNKLLLETLERAAGTLPDEILHHDLDALIGSWIHDPATEEALREQRKVDPKDWQ